MSALEARGPEDYEARGPARLTLQLDLEGLVEPLAGFVEVGEHTDGPLTFVGEGRELAYGIATLAIDDERHRPALRALGRIPGEHHKLLETFHVSIAVGRCDIDDLAIMQCALLDGLPDCVQEFIGSQS